ncbi:hypothetical protein KIL84_009566 [Mauremys mutica]|uniref:Uncharacterized protein n=1 Tax=Mauremys mutica TaxID=74926 RepID=A0A9D4AZ12_9SAUR|nr:hypothetical protein KIL84_009566 [Mauremys mutica]
MITMETTLQLESPWRQGQGVDTHPPRDPSMDMALPRTRLSLFGPLREQHSVSQSCIDPQPLPGPLLARQHWNRQRRRLQTLGNYHHNPRGESPTSQSTPPQPPASHRLLPARAP